MVSDDLPANIVGFGVTSKGQMLSNNLAQAWAAHGGGQATGCARHSGVWELCCPGAPRYEHLGGLQQRAPPAGAVMAATGAGAAVRPRCTADVGGLPALRDQDSADAVDNAVAAWSEGEPLRLSTIFSTNQLRHVHAIVGATLTKLTYEPDDDDPGVVDFTPPVGADADAAPPFVWPQLTSLTVSCTCLRTIQFDAHNTPKLEELKLSNLNTAAGGPDPQEFHLALPELRSLVCEFGEVRDASGLGESLTRCPKLELIMFRKFAGLGRVGTHYLFLPNCQSLTFYRADDLDRLCVWGPKLRELDLQECHSLSFLRVLRHDHDDIRKVVAEDAPAPNADDPLTVTLKKSVTMAIAGGTRAVVTEEVIERYRASRDGDITEAQAREACKESIAASMRAAMSHIQPAIDKDYAGAYRWVVARRLSVQAGKPATDRILVNLMGSNIDTRSLSLLQGRADVHPVRSHRDYEMPVGGTDARDAVGHAAAEGAVDASSAGAGAGAADGTSEPRAGATTGDAPSAAEGSGEGDGASSSRVPVVRRFPAHADGALNGETNEEFASRLYERGRPAPEPEVGGGADGTFMDIFGGGGGTAGEGAAPTGPPPGVDMDELRAEFPHASPAELDRMAQMMATMVALGGPEGVAGGGQ